MQQNALTRTQRPLSNVAEPAYPSSYRILTNILMTLFPLTFVDLSQFIVTISKCLPNGVIILLAQFIFFLSGKLTSQYGWSVTFKTEIGTN